MSPVVRRGAKETSGAGPIAEVGNRFFFSFRGGGGCWGSLGLDNASA